MAEMTLKPVPPGVRAAFSRYQPSLAAQRSLLLRLAALRLMGRLRARPAPPAQAPALDPVSV
jgi:hypothetical protein